MKKTLSSIQKTLALTLSVVLFYEAAAIPLAEASQMGSIWAARQQNLSTLSPGADLSSQNRPSKNLSSRPTLPAVIKPFGAVVSQWAPAASTNKAPLVLLQDIHGHAAAQLNLADMLESLRGHFGGETLHLALEGAWSTLPVEEYETIRSPSRANTLRAFVEADAATGPQLAALNAPAGTVEPFGAEDKILYLKNLRSRDDFEAARVRMTESLSFIRQRMDRIGRRWLPARALELDRLRAQRKRDHSGLGAYLSALSRMNPDLSLYPQIQTALRAFQFEEEGASDLASREREALVSSLLGKASAETRDRLTRLALNFKTAEITPAQFHSTLLAIARQEGISIPLHLKAFTKTLSEQEKLDPSSLFEEVERLENSLVHQLTGRLAEFDRAKRFLALSAQLEDQIEFFSLELTPRNADRVSREGQNLNWVEVERFLFQLERDLDLAPAARVVPTDFAKGVKQAAEFYSLAKQRDQAFLTNINNHMARKKTSGEPIVLVAGGFHTEGLTRLLKKGGQPYVVARPNLNRPSDSVNPVRIVGSLPSPSRPVLTSETLLALKGPSLPAPWPYLQESLKGVQALEGKTSGENESAHVRVEKDGDQILISPKTGEEEADHLSAQEKYHLRYKIPGWKKFTNFVLFLLLSAQTLLATAQEKIFKDPNVRPIPTTVDPATTELLQSNHAKTDRENWEKARHRAILSRMSTPFTKDFPNDLSDDTPIELGPPIWISKEGLWRGDRGLLREKYIRRFPKGPVGVSLTDETMTFKTWDQFEDYLAKNGQQMLDPRNSAAGPIAAINTMMELSEIRTIYYPNGVLDAGTGLHSRNLPETGRSANYSFIVLDPGQNMAILEAFSSLNDFEAWAEEKGLKKNGVYTSGAFKGKKAALLHPTGEKQTEGALKDLGFYETISENGLILARRGDVILVNPDTQEITGVYEASNQTQGALEHRHPMEKMLNQVYFKVRWPVEPFLQVRDLRKKLKDPSLKQSEQDSLLAKIDRIKKENDLLFETYEYVSRTAQKRYRSQWDVSEFTNPETVPWLFIDPKDGHYYKWQLGAVPLGLKTDISGAIVDARYVPDDFAVKENERNPKKSFYEEMQKRDRVIFNLTHGTGRALFAMKSYREDPVRRGVDSQIAPLQESGIGLEWLLYTRGGGRTTPPPVVLSAIEREAYIQGVPVQRVVDPLVQDRFRFSKVEPTPLDAGLTFLFPQYVGSRDKNHAVLNAIEWARVKGPLKGKEAEEKLDRAYDQAWLTIRWLRDLEKYQREKVRRNKTQENIDLFNLIQAAQNQIWFNPISYDLEFFAGKTDEPKPGKTNYFLQLTGQLQSYENQAANAVGPKARQLEEMRDQIKTAFDHWEQATADASQFEIFSGVEPRISHYETVLDAYHEKLRTLKAEINELIADTRVEPDPRVRLNNKAKITGLITEYENISDTLSWEDEEGFFHSLVTPLYEARERARREQQREQGLILPSLRDLFNLFSGSSPTLPGPPFLLTSALLQQEGEPTKKVDNALFEVEQGKEKEGVENPLFQKTTPVNTQVQESQELNRFKEKALQWFENSDNWITRGDQKLFPRSNVGDPDLEGVVFLYDAAIAAQTLLGQGKGDEAKALLLRIVDGTWAKTPYGGYADSYDFKNNRPFDQFNDRARETNGPQMHLALSLLKVWAADPTHDPRLFRAAHGIALKILNQAEQTERIYGDESAGAIPYGPSPQRMADDRPFDSLFNPEYQINAVALFTRLSEVLGEADKPEEERTFWNASEKSLDWLFQNRFDEDANQFWSLNTRQRKDFPKDLLGWSLSEIGPERLEEKGLDIEKAAVDLASIPHLNFIFEWLVNQRNGLVITARYLSETNKPEAAAQASQDAEKLTSFLLRLPFQPEDKGNGLPYALRSFADPETDPVHWVENPNWDTLWGWETMEGSSGISIFYGLSSLVFNHDPVSGAIRGTDINWAPLSAAVPELPDQPRTPITSPQEQPQITQTTPNENSTVTDSDPVVRGQNLPRVGEFRPHELQTLSDAAEQMAILEILFSQGRNGGQDWRFTFTKKGTTDTETFNSWAELENRVFTQGPFLKEESPAGIFSAANFLNRVYEEGIVETEDGVLEGFAYASEEESGKIQYLLIDPAQNYQVAKRFNSIYEYWTWADNQNLTAEAEWARVTADVASQGRRQFRNNENIHTVSLPGNDSKLILAPAANLATVDPATHRVTGLYWAEDPSQEGLPKFAFKEELTPDRLTRIKTLIESGDTGSLGWFKLVEEKGKSFLWSTRNNTTSREILDTRVILPDNELGDRVVFHPALRRKSAPRSAFTHSPVPHTHSQNGLIFSQRPGSRINISLQVYGAPKTKGDRTLNTPLFIENQKIISGIADSEEKERLSEIFEENKAAHFWISDIEADLRNQFAQAQGNPARQEQILDRLAKVDAARQNTWTDNKGFTRLIAGRTAYLRHYSLWEKMAEGDKRTQLAAALKNAWDGGFAAPSPRISALETQLTAWEEKLISLKDEKAGLELKLKNEKDPLQVQILTWQIRDKEASLRRLKDEQSFKDEKGALHSVIAPSNLIQAILDRVENYTPTPQLDAAEEQELDEKTPDPSLILLPFEDPFTPLPNSFVEKNRNYETQFEDGFQNTWIKVTTRKGNFVHYDILDFAGELLGRVRGEVVVYRGNKTYSPEALPGKLQPSDQILADFFVGVKYDRKGNKIGERMIPIANRGLLSAGNLVSEARDFDQRLTSKTRITSPIIETTLLPGRKDFVNVKGRFETYKEQYKLPTQADPNVYPIRREYTPGNEEFYFDYKPNPVTGQMVPGEVFAFRSGELKETRKLINIDANGRTTYQINIIGKSETPAKGLLGKLLSEIPWFRSTTENAILAVRYDTLEEDGILYSRETPKFFSPDPLTPEFKVPSTNRRVYQDVDTARLVYARSGQPIQNPLYSVHAEDETPNQFGTIGVPALAYKAIHNPLEEGLIDRMAIYTVNFNKTYDNSKAAPVPEEVLNLITSYGKEAPAGRQFSWERTVFVLGLLDMVNQRGETLSPLLPVEMETEEGVTHFSRTYEDFILGSEIYREFIPKRSDGRFYVKDENGFIRPSAPETAQVPSGYINIRFPQRELGEISPDLRNVIRPSQGEAAKELAPSGSLPILTRSFDGRKIRFVFEDQFDRPILTVEYLTDDASLTNPRAGRIFHAVRLNDWIMTDDGQWHATKSISYDRWGNIIQEKVLQFDEAGQPVIDPQTGEALYQVTPYFHIDLPGLPAFVRIFAPNLLTEKGEPFLELNTRTGLVAEKEIPVGSQSFSLQMDPEAATDFFAQHAVDLVIPQAALGPNGEKISSYEAVYDAETDSLRITRLSEKGGVWETSVLERAPENFQSAFGVFSRWRTRSVYTGTVQDGEKTLLRKSISVFSDDVGDHPELAGSEAAFTKIQKHAAENFFAIGKVFETGRIVFDIVPQTVNGPLFTPNSQRLAFTILNKPLVVSLDENGLKLLAPRLTDWGLADPTVSFTNSQGKDVTQLMDKSRTEIIESEFNFDKLAWTPLAAVLKEPLPRGFIPYDPQGKINEDELVPVEKSQLTKTLPMRDYFPSEPAGASLFRVESKPTPFVGQPDTQSLESFYDDLGRLWVQHQRTPDIDRMTYFPQLKARPFARRERNDLIPFDHELGALTSPTDKQAEFLFYFAQGEGAPGHMVDVMMGNKAVARIFPSESVHGHLKETFSPENPDTRELNFWHPDFDDPLVLRESGLDMFRFSNVRPMDGKKPLFQTGANPVARVIPLAWLRDQGIPTENISLKIIPSVNGRLQTTAVQVLRNPEIKGRVQVDQRGQKKFFPKGEPHHLIKETGQQVLDFGTGVVQVFKGSGTNQKVLVYEDGRLISLSFYLKNGKAYDHVRVQFSDNLAGPVHVPQLVETHFQGIMARLTQPLQLENGRWLIQVGNVNQSVSISLLPNALTRFDQDFSPANFNNMPTYFVPSGLYDPKAPFPNLNGNIVNGLIRFFKPNWEPAFDGLGDPKELIENKHLNPHQIKEIVQNIPLSLPSNWESREPFVPAGFLPDLETNLSSPEIIFQWADKMAEGMEGNYPTFLPLTHPDSIRADYSETQKAGKILLGLLGAYKTAIKEGETEKAERYLSAVKRSVHFYNRATNGGNKPLLSGYREDGAKHQISDEWRLPGMAIPTSSANISLARAALELAKISQSPGDWAFSAKLTQQVLTFIPATDYFWSQIEPHESMLQGNKKKSSLNAVKIVEGMERLIGPDGIHGDKNDKPDSINFLEQRIKEAGLNQRGSDFQKKTLKEIADLLDGSRSLRENKEAATARVLERTRQKIAEDPSLMKEVKKEAIDLLAAVLLTNSSQRADLDSLMYVAGGVAEYVPITPIHVPDLGISLTPATDNYVLSTNQEALVLFREFKEVFSTGEKTHPWEAVLKTNLETAEDNLEDWFTHLILPEAERHKGHVPHYWRQQDWIEGVRVTGVEGTDKPYVIVPNRFPTLRASLSVIESSLLLDSSEANKEKLRGWMRNLLKVYGSQINPRFNKMVGLDFVPETMGRPEGRVLSSELTARFTALSRQLDYREGETWGLSAMNSFWPTLEDGMFRAVVGVSPDVVDTQRGLTTGDGKVLFTRTGEKSSGNFTLEPLSTLHLFNLREAFQPTSPNQLDSARQNADGDFEVQSLKTRVKDFLRAPPFVLVQVLLSWLAFAAFFWVILSLKRFKLRKEIKNESLFWRAGRDLLVIPLWYLPSAAVLYLMGVTPFSIAVSAALAFYGTLWTVAEIWSVRAERYARKKLQNNKPWHKIKPDEKIYDEEIIMAHYDRFYKRVLGMRRGEPDGGRAPDADPEDFWVFNVPNQFPIEYSTPDKKEKVLVPPGEGFIGTAEGGFVTGLNYIHILSLEFFKRKKGLSQEILSADHVPDILDPTALQKDDRDLEKVDRFIRRASEALRRQMDGDKPDSHMFAYSVFYYSQKAEELRKILARPMKEGNSKELDSKDIKDFEQILTEMGVFLPNGKPEEDINIDIRRFASENNIRSIHPYINETASMLPKLIIFTLLFSFLWGKDGISPIEVILNNMVAPTQAQEVSLILFGVGVLGYLVSFVFYNDGNFLVNLNHMGRIRRFLQTSLGRLIPIGMLISGAGGAALLAPGILQGYPDFAGILLPMLFALLFLSEIVGIFGKLSILYLTLKFHFGPTHHMGSARAISFYYLQNALFYIIGLWMAFNVAPFFEGHLVSAWEGFEFINSASFNLPLHLVGGVAVSGLLVAFLLTAFQSKYEPDERAKKSFWLPFIPLWLFVGGVVVLFDLYRPLGGYVVGSAALLMALYLFYSSVFNLIVGFAAVSMKIGKIRNLFEAGIPMIFFGIISGQLANIFPILTPFLPAAWNLGLLYFPIVILFYLFFLVTAFSLGDALFAFPIALFGAAAFLLPEWSGTSFAIQAFFVFIGIAVTLRVGLYVFHRFFVDPLYNPDSPESFFIGLTGGNPTRSHALKDPEGAVNMYMDLWDTVIEPNTFPAKRMILDDQGRPLTRGKIRDTLHFIFKHEHANQQSLFGEEAIVIGDKETALKAVRDIARQPDWETQYKNSGAAGLTFTQMKLALAKTDSGKPMNLLFFVNNEEEANLLRLGLRVQRYFVTRMNISHSQRDTMWFVVQMAYAIKEAGLDKETIISIQSNNYKSRRELLRKFKNDEEKKTTNKNFIINDQYYLDQDPAHFVRKFDKEEMDNRIALSRFITLTTGIRTEITHNDTFGGMKSGAQNGDGTTFRKVRGGLILDRNVQSFTLKQVVQDMRRLYNQTVPPGEMDPDEAQRPSSIAGIISRRTTPNIAFPMGESSDKTENGFTNFLDALLGPLGGYDGEMVAIGWGQMPAMPLNDMYRAFSNPDRPYRFNTNLGGLDRAFGAIHGFRNLPHQSEDYLQQIAAKSALESQGLHPVLLSSTAKYYKLREFARTIELLAARTRWSGGGDPGQKGRDIFIQRIAEFGTDSVFKREMQKNRGRYYVLAPLAMTNVLFTPILIVTGYIPFAGILLLFWGIGIVSNQVLTMASLASFIERNGVWGGLSIWLWQRFRDMINFGGLIFIELYGVIETIVKGKYYAYVFALSGNANINDYTANQAQILVDKPEAYRLFRWLFFTGMIGGLVLNVFAMIPLDPLNALMLFPTLFFTLGLMMGPYIYQHQKGPGDSFLDYKRWLPKVFGFFIGLTALTLFSLGAGIFSQFHWPGVFQFIEVGGILPGTVLLSAGLGILFWLIPSRKILVAPKNALARTHNRTVWFIWLILTLGTAFVFQFPAASPMTSYLSGAVVALGAALNFFYITFFMIFNKDTSRLSGNFFNQPINKIDLKKSYEREMLEKNKESGEVAVSTVKIPEEDGRPEHSYFWATATRMALLTIGALMWFVIVASAALTSARVLDYNLTLNYQQVYLFLFHSFSVIGFIILAGFLLRRFYHARNWFKYKRLHKKYHRLLKTKDDAGEKIHPLVDSIFNANEEGFRVSRETHSPLEGAAHLKEIARLLKNPEAMVDSYKPRPLPTTSAASYSRKGTVLTGLIFVLAYFTDVSSVYGDTIGALSPVPGSRPASFIILFLSALAVSFLRRKFSEARAKPKRVSSFDEQEIQIPAEALASLSVEAPEIRESTVFSGASLSGREESALLGSLKQLAQELKEALLKKSNGRESVTHVLMVRDESQVPEIVRQFQVVRIFQEGRKERDRVKFLLGEDISKEGRKTLAALSSPALSAEVVDFRLDPLKPGLGAEIAASLEENALTQGLRGLYHVVGDSQLALLVEQSLTERFARQIRLTSLNNGDEAAWAKAILSYTLGESFTKKLFADLKTHMVGGDNWIAKFTLIMKQA